MVETEKGVIIVAYKEVRRNQRFLILKRTKNWEGWELPKGHLEKNDHKQTVKIELNEEAGIPKNKIKNIKDLEKHTEWTYERNNTEYQKKYKQFLVEVEEDCRINTNNNPDEEHEQGLFLNYKDAKSLLTYENNKKFLEEAKEQIH